MVSTLGAVMLLTAVAACGTDRPAPRREAAPAGASGVRQIPLRPGIPGPEPRVVNPFAGDDQALNEGRRLYSWMNCIGCHFEGGGGIGPPLMDDQWIYGGRPDQIFDSVANGRANGMPAYGDKLVPEEIWRIVAYVETLNPDRTGDSNGGEESGAENRQGGGGA
jgi:cytochrome c oxidase cbb3-type subunit 3